MKFLLYLSFSALLFSCAGYKDNVVYNDVETACQDSFVTLADLYGHAEMIPLENKEEAMISFVHKLEVTPEGFFICDLSNSRLRVLFFDDKGSFVTQIGRVGGSKEEYTYMDDVSVNKAKKEVAILTKGHQIKLYSYDGKYKDEIILQDDVWYEKLQCCGDMYICAARHNDKGDSLVCLFDQKGMVISKHVASLPLYISEASFVSNPIQTNDGKMLYVDFFKSMFSFVDLEKPLQESTYKMNLGNMFVYTGEDEMKNMGDNLVSGYYNDDAIYGWMNHDSSLSYYQIDLKNNRACVCPFYDWAPTSLTVAGGCAYALLSQDQVLSLCVQKIRTRIQQT